MIALDRVLPLLEQLDAQFPSVEESLGAIEAADQERQIRWLRSYLLQMDVVRFWKGRPSADALHFFCIAEEPSLNDLFNLSARVPIAAQQQGESLLAPVPDPDADVLLAMQLQAEDLGI